MQYDPHEALTAPARASANPLRLVAGIVLIIAAFLALAGFYNGFVTGLFGTIADNNSPLGIVLSLSGFVCLTTALAFTLQIIHKRRLMGLIGTTDLALQQFRTCCLALLPFYAFITLLPSSEGTELSAHLPLATWLLWLPLALPALLIQISAEELIFRGYLQSQLAARFSHPLIWIGLPSALFGLIHYDPTVAGENAWMLAAWAGLFGLAAADLTARAGTLGPALALHFINNIFAFLITSPQNDFDGLALYTFPMALDDPDLPWHVFAAEMLLVLCVWLILRLKLRR